MSLFDTLLSLFRDEDTYNEYSNDREGFLQNQGLGDVTSADVNAVLPQVLTEIQSNTQSNTNLAQQGGAANFGGSGNVVLGGPGLPVYQGEGGGLQSAVEAIDHYYTNVFNFTQQTFEDNDTNIFQDNDTTVDNSVDQNILAFGDVNQTFDQDTAIGDRSIADGGEGSVNNTGDGAVQNTGIIADSTIATGDVGGSVTGDVTDSVVGDGNQVIDDSLVGAAAFGEGDAINAENVNQGDGNLTDIDNSLVNESAIGGSNLTSNDTSVVAGDDSNVAFGEGSSIDTQDTTVANFGGTVQVAGDESTQLGQTDNSVDDSYNTTDNSVDYQDNDLLDVDDNDAVDIDDQDFIDADVSGSTDELGPEMMA